MRFFLHKFVATVMLSTLATSVVSAEKWEPCLLNTSALKVFCTSEGNVLSSDYDYIRQSGGIYYSTDHGTTWEKSNAPDYWYWDFCQSDEYIWAPGFGCHVARSEDGGKSWLTLSFKKLAEEYMSDRDLADIDYVQAYTATYDAAHGRLYIGVFSQSLGVIYSDDNGETWQRTNPEGFLVAYDADKGVAEYDNIYTVITFNDNVYALGMLFHYIYDREADSWSRITDDSGTPITSNFLAMANVLGDTLYASRAMEDDREDTPYMLKTRDMVHWEAMPRPEGVRSNYVNGICNDGEKIYGLSFHEGVCYTSDNGASWCNLGKSGYPVAKPQQFIGESMPTGIAVDDKYVYICLFELSNPDSGVYRMPRPSGCGVNAVETEVIAVNVIGNQLIVAGDSDAEILVSDVAGAVRLNVQGRTADLSALPAGLYVYNVKANNKASRGKFIKK